MEYEEGKSSFWSLQNILIILIIVFILVIVGVFFWMFAGENEKKDLDETPEYILFIQQSERGEGNIEICNNIDQEELKLECEANFIKKDALDKKDISLCNSIIDENQKFYCKYSVVLNKALENENEEICNEIELGIESCVREFKFEMTKIKNDVSYCEGLAEEYYEECLSFVSSENL